ncbi:unnamed protein product [marine sediment metagenome]|uniref:Uncharacterized protein n=1 Tax=marine sediment metagenome TaxID=412755 RepID=X1J8R8_9ZZZZ
MIEVEWIGIVLSTVICLVFTVYFVKRASKGTRNTLDSLGRSLDQGILDINEQLKPIIDANSRAMGVVSRLSDSGKMDKAIESRIGKDLIGQNEDVLEMIKMAFPNVAEYIESHPEAITKLMPRLNTLISDPEARKRLNLDLSGTKSDIKRIWEDERD